MKGGTMELNGSAASVCEITSAAAALTTVRRMSAPPRIGCKGVLTFGVDQEFAQIVRNFLQIDLGCVCAGRQFVWQAEGLGLVGPNCKRPRDRQWKQRAPRD